MRHCRSICLSLYKNISTCCLAALVLLCCACSSNDISRGATGWVLPRDAIIYIAYPNYVDQDAIDSKPRMRNYLAKSLFTLYKERFVHTFASEQPQSLIRAFHLANVAGSDFLVYSQLNALQDRHNTWVERNNKQGLDDNTTGRDYVHMSIALYDVRSRQLIDVIQLKSQSGIALTGSGNIRTRIDKLLTASVDQLLPSI